MNYFIISVTYLFLLLVPALMWGQDITTTDHKNSHHQTILIQSIAHQNTKFICGKSSISFFYNGEMVTYGTVKSNGNCWLDRNLGAKQVATGPFDKAAYGDLIQWGKTSPSQTNEMIAKCDIQAESSKNSFILTNQPPNDWDNSGSLKWRSTAEEHNPCPTGWGIPSEEDWLIELSNWKRDDLESAAKSSLKLPATGIRNHATGNIEREGVVGYYWTSTEEAPFSRHLIFNKQKATISSSPRANGMAIRCIKK